MFNLRPLYITKYLTGPTGYGDPLGSTYVFVTANAYDRKIGNCNSFIFIVQEPTLTCAFIYSTLRVGSVKLPLGVIGSPLEMVHAIFVYWVSVVSPNQTPIQMTNRMFIA